MNIPKTIQIIGREIKIEYDENIMRDDDNIGLAKIREGKILLVPIGTKTTNVTKESIEVTFIHELLHYILHSTRYYKLHSDEDFVSRISEVLYQVIKQII